MMFASLCTELASDRTSDYAAGGLALVRREVANDAVLQRHAPARPAVHVVGARIHPASHTARQRRLGFAGGLRAMQPPAAQLSAQLLRCSGALRHQQQCVNHSIRLLEISVCLLNSHGAPQS